MPFFGGEGGEGTSPAAGEASRGRLWSACGGDGAGGGTKPSDARALAGMTHASKRGVDVRGGHRVWFTPEGCACEARATRLSGWCAQMLSGEGKGGWEGVQ